MSIFPCFCTHIEVLNPGATDERVLTVTQRWNWLWFSWGSKEIYRWGVW